MKWGEEFDPERGSPCGEQTCAEGKRLAARGRNDGRGASALPGLRRDAGQPGRGAILPGGFRSGGDEQTRAARGREFQFELHRPILAEETDKGCPSPREKMRG